MSHRKTTSAVILILTMLLDIVCLFSLPHEIAVQWNDAGDATCYISKYHALLIGYSVTLSSLWLWSKVCTKAAFLRIMANILGFALSCSGIVLSIVLLILNQRMFSGEFSPLGWSILWSALYFAVQLLLCFHVRNKFVKCIPVYLSVIGILFTLYIFFDPFGLEGVWHELAAVIVGVIIAYAISGVIAAWILYWIMSFIEKRKNCKNF